MADFPECNSAGLLPLIPCYECVDAKALKAMKVVVLCNIVNAVAPLGVDCTDAGALRNSAACLACASDQDLERLETAGLCAYARAARRRDGECTAEALMDDAKCLNCLSEHDLNAIYKWLFCKWLEYQASLI